MATKEPEYSRISDFFPGKFRPLQRECLEALGKALNNPKVKYVIFEGPTGIGKSWLAIAALLAAKSGYIATMNKFLQDQYLRDFSQHVEELKGRANYNCYKYDHYNCGNAPCRKSKKSRTQCSSEGSCGFHVQFRKATAADTVLFNFQAAISFLGMSNFPLKNLMVIDEAHNLPDALTGAATLEVKTRLLKEMSIMDEVPYYDRAVDYKNFLMDLNAKIAVRLTDTATPDQVSALENIVNASNLILNIDPDLQHTAVTPMMDINNGKQTYTGFNLRPTLVRSIGHKYLFNRAKKVVLMSATVLNFELLKTMVGIDDRGEDDGVTIIQAPSLFPKENRKMFFQPVGAINRNNIDYLMPKIVTEIENILLKYPDQKGIIHGTTYKACDAIFKSVKAKHDRIIYPRSAGEQRRAFEEHCQSKEPTVLLSPSMTEGVDLKDDLCAFQILVRVPWANLGDRVVKVRTDTYQGYYNWFALLKTIQAYGRGVRSMDDKADFYLLDGAFERLFRDSTHFTPAWIKEALPAALQF